MGRAFYTSSNGDRWLLLRQRADGRCFVRHEANLASGGYVTEIGLSAFLVADRGGLEHQALWLLIATLTDDEPTPDKSVA